MPKYRIYNNKKGWKQINIKPTFESALKQVNIDRSTWIIIEQNEDCDIPIATINTQQDIDEYKKLTKEKRNKR